MAQEVALDLGGGGARPQASHHCYQLLGFDLAFPLAVVQRETLLKLCGHMNTLHTCAGVHIVALFLHQSCGLNRVSDVSRPQPECVTCWEKVDDANKVQRKLKSNFSLHS